MIVWFETQIAGSDEGFVPGFLSVQDALLASFLMFIDNSPPGVEWKSDGSPKIQSLVARQQSRPCFVENPIWWWQPGVVGYSHDGTPFYE